MKVMSMPENYLDMKKENENYLFEMDGEIGVKGNVLYVSLYDKKQDYYPIVKNFNLDKYIKEEFSFMMENLKCKTEDGYELHQKQTFGGSGLRLCVKAVREGKVYAKKQKTIRWKQLFNHEIPCAEYLKPTSYPEEMLGNPWH